MHEFLKHAYRKRSSATLMGVGLLLSMMFTISIATQSPVSAGTAIWSPNSVVQDVAPGNGATCAVADSVPYCWGKNSNGNLGTTAVAIDATALYPVPVDTTGVLDGKAVTKIAAGSLTYFCAIADGKPYCWGRNSYGMFGDGTRNNSSVPVATIASNALAGKTVTDISTGDGHVCAIADGEAYCWGTNGQGRLGDNTYISRYEPTAVYTGGALNGKTVTSITAESGTSCAVADGSVYCWGNNNEGQVGDGTTTTRIQPVKVGIGTAMESETMVKVSSKNGGACAYSQSGKVYCWGMGNAGQLGHGTVTPNTLSPVRVVGSLSGKQVIDLSTGQWRPCALDSNTKPHCWGNGLLGDGTYSSRSAPVPVIATGALANVTLLRISNGANRVSCAQSSNVTYCWGENPGSMLGTGSTSSSLEPDYVRSLEPLGTSAYRLYKNANSTLPESPLATKNASAQLTLAGEAFRLRTDVNAGTHGVAPNDNSFKLQYATKSAASCSAQTTGFTDITDSTSIAYNTNPSVTSGANIATHGNDPTASSITAPQSYISASGAFTNPNVINPDKKGLWDFSLKDNNAPTNTSFCMRIVYGDGTPLESSTQFPEIRSANPELSVNIVNAAGSTVSSPNFTLSNALTQSSCQTTTGSIGTSAQRIRVFNSQSPTGWSLSLAATAGATASWQQGGGGASYDYNDGSGSPPGCNSGSDGDSIAGQLAINPSPATVTPQSGCSTTGITKGSSSAFSQGSTDAITLASASSGATLGCYWDFTAIGMNQKIPAFQESGLYSIDMTLTVVAQ